MRFRIEMMSKRSPLPEDEGWMKTGTWREPVWQRRSAARWDRLPACPGWNEGKQTPMARPVRHPREAHAGHHRRRSALVASGTGWKPIPHWRPMPQREDVETTAFARRRRIDDKRDLVLTQRTPSPPSPRSRGPTAKISGATRGRFATRSARPRGALPPPRSVRCAGCP